MQIMFRNYACQSRVLLFSPFVSKLLYDEVNSGGCGTTGETFLSLVVSPSCADLSNMLPPQDIIIYSNCFVSYKTAVIYTNGTTQDVHNRLIINSLVVKLSEIACLWPCHKLETVTWLYPSDSLQGKWDSLQHPGNSKVQQQCR